MLLIKAFPFNIFYSKSVKVKIKKYPTTNFLPGHDKLRYYFQNNFFLKVKYSVLSFYVTSTSIYNLEVPATFNCYRISAKARAINPRRTKPTNKGIALAIQPHPSVIRRLSFHETMAGGLLATFFLSRDPQIQVSYTARTDPTIEREREREKGHACALMERIRSGDAIT